MNRIEHLLVCLAEECGEVAKECHKALRFGLDDRVTLDPNGPRGSTGPTNREKINREIIDLLAVISMCAAEGVIPEPRHGVEQLTPKWERVRAYMGYAERVGALQPSQTTANDGQPPQTNGAATPA